MRCCHSHYVILQSALCMFLILLSSMSSQQVTRTHLEIILLEMTLLFKSSRLSNPFRSVCTLMEQSSVVWLNSFIYSSSLLWLRNQGTEPVCTHTHICTHTMCTHMHPHKHTPVCTHVHICNPTHMHIHAHTHKYTGIYHTHVRTHRTFACTSSQSAVQDFRKTVRDDGRFEGQW